MRVFQFLLYHIYVRKLFFPKMVSSDYILKYNGKFRFSDNGYLVSQSKQV